MPHLLRSAAQFAQLPGSETAACLAPEVGKRGVRQGKRRRPRNSNASSRASPASGPTGLGAPDSGGSWLPPAPAHSAVWLDPFAVRCKVSVGMRDVLSGWIGRNI
jgi:hypothetical protein